MAPTFSSTEILEASQGVRERSIALLRSGGEQQATTIVPTCPMWTAKELACHMYGVSDDILNGRLDGVGSGEWTRAQVDRHDATPLADLLDEWEASAAGFDAIVPLIPEPANAQFVMDQATHEHDLRLALASPGAQDDLSVSIGAAFLLTGLRGSDAELADRIEGLGLSEFELLRALTGRRSVAQLEAMGIPADRLSGFLDPTPMTIVEIDLVEGAG